MEGRSLLGLYQTTVLYFLHDSLTLASLWCFLFRLFVTYNTLCSAHIAFTTFLLSTCYTTLHSCRPTGLFPSLPPGCGTHCQTTSPLQHLLQLFDINWKHFYFVDFMTMSTRDYWIICFLFYRFILWFLFLSFRCVLAPCIVTWSCGAFALIPR